MNVSMKQLQVLKSVITALNKIYDDYDYDYDITTTEDGSIQLSGSDYFEFKLLSPYLQKEFEAGLVVGDWNTITIPSKK